MRPRRQPRAARGARSTPAPQDVGPQELGTRCAALVQGGGRVQFAYAWFPSAEELEVRYVLYPAVGEPLEIWRCRPGEQELPSLAPIAPLLSWYEREMTDLAGVRFCGQPQPEPLVLLPGAVAAYPPLWPGLSAPLRYTAQPPSLPEMSGPDRDAVQTLPFGPIRADVLESAHYLFYYVGEAILHYHPELFFKHRGMEKRFERLSSGLGVVLAERVSALGSVAHALGYCQAIEAAAACTVPPRARWLRVLLAELERLYNHLHYLGHLCHTTTLKVGEAQGKYLEERAKQINARATGSRFLRSFLTPGGLRREPQLAGLAEAVTALRSECRRYGAMLEASTTHLDRLITTGQLAPQLAFDQGATGPIERASGLDRDPRRDQPYAAYDELAFEVAVRTAGDAHARQQVRIDELEQSIGLILQVLQGLPSGPIRVDCRPPAGSEGIGWSESARGALYYAVHIGADGALARVKIKSPSYSNWRVFPFTVHDTNMMDYAINEASFGLTIAGCAR